MKTIKMRPLASISAGIALLVTLFASALANAAVVPVCTAISGCTPDIDVGGTATYTTNGNGTGGTLVLQSGANTGMNIAVLFDEVLDYNGDPFAVADLSDPNNTSSVPNQLRFAMVGASYEVVLNIDAAGNATGGSIKIGDNTGISTGPIANSWVADTIHGADLGNPGIPGSQIHDILFNGGDGDAVRTASGLELRATQGDDDAYLSGTVSGSAVGGIAISTGSSSAISIGFQGGEVTGGLLSEYGGNWAVTGLTQSISGVNSSNFLDTNWSSAFNGPLDIVVPVPGAIVFYLSGLAAFAGIRSRVISK